MNSNHKPDFPDELARDLPYQEPQLRPSRDESGDNHHAARDVHYIRTERSRFRLSPKQLLCVIFGLCLTGVCIFLYFSRTQQTGDVPVITAENGPIKIRPHGNENVKAAQEPAIYNELTPGEQKEKTGNLLAEPEKPQSQTPTLPDDFMKALGEGQDSDGQVVGGGKESEAVLSGELDQPGEKNMDSEGGIRTQEKTSREALAETTNIFVDDGKADESSNAGSGSAESTPSREMEVAKISVKSTKMAPAKKSSVPGVPATGHFYRVQIASVTSHKMAEEQWEIYRKKAPGLLGPYKPVIQRVDLGQGIGIRYRLQVGQFTKDSAKAFCTELKKLKIDCWIVRP